MTPRRFYRLSLVLPIAIPLALVPFEPSALSVLLWGAIAFGGAAYLPFAAVLFFWVGRLRTLAQTQVLSFCAPLIYLPFLAVTVLVFAATQSPTGSVVGEAWKAVGALSIFALLVGYVYVVVANALALLLEGVGLLQGQNPDQRLGPAG